MSERLCLLLSRRAIRLALYSTVAVVLLAGGITALTMRRSFDLAVSDGQFYYAYLPSLFLDGDLDCNNQLRDVPAQPNKFPVGTALSLAPGFVAAHGVARVCSYLSGGAAWCRADGYSATYQVLLLAYILGLCVVTASWMDDVLTRGFAFAPHWSALAVLLAWIGSPLLYYTCREPLMAHAVGWFWVTAVVWLVWRLAVRAGRGEVSTARLAMLAMAVAMALITRPTNAVVVVLLVYLLGVYHRTGLLRRLFCRLGVPLVVGVVPCILQACTWQAQFGRWVVWSYGSERFHWGQPAAWQTLFSSRHGLFFWSPILLASFYGVVWRLRRTKAGPRGLLLGLVLAFTLLWYCNSCWWCWWFGDACGARAFSELGLLFAVGLGGAAEAVARRGPMVQRLAIGLLGLALIYQLALVGLYIARWIPRGEALL